jgi:hypothetical protein
VLNEAGDSSSVPATGAPVVPLGVEHEVVDDELRAALEQVEQRPRAVGALELVGLCDLDHRELAALGVEPVALAGEVLLLVEQRTRAAVHSSCETIFGKPMGNLLRRPGHTPTRLRPPRTGHSSVGGAPG